MRERYKMSRPCSQQLHRKYNEKRGFTYLKNIWYKLAWNENFGKPKLLI